MMMAFSSFHNWRQGAICKFEDNKNREYKNAWFMSSMKTKDGKGIKIIKLKAMS